MNAGPTPLALTDPLPLAQALMRCRSVTPVDDGALDLLGGWLTRLGFTVQRLTFGAVDNLYARRGGAGVHLCLAGHTDVVPPGDLAAWRVDPFAADVHDGWLIGRGASDMKSALAAMVAAVAQADAAGEPTGPLSFLLTGDEEGPAQDGTTRVLDWMVDQGERPDLCLVGEPTSAARLGDTIKIGRRGSLNATLTVRGIQGHVAYPQRADNPITRLVRILDRLKARVLDEGTDWFQPSNLEVTNLEVGNPTENLIPAQASARLNIRFNVAHHSSELLDWIRAVAADEAADVSIEARVSGEAFFTEPGALSDLVAGAITAHTGVAPQLNTLGGTSDARFIRRLCPVVEFGLVGATMHQIDERVQVDDIATLARIYRTVITAPRVMP